jgi:hypothetical protein
MEANNKLIAEFMGIDQVDIDTYQETNSNLKYHTSWDWLMPVVKKCRQDNRLEYFDFVYYAIEMCDINVTYKAVVEFIKNQNN